MDFTYNTVSSTYIAPKMDILKGIAIACYVKCTNLKMVRPLFVHFMFSSPSAFIFTLPTFFTIIIILAII